MEKLGEAPKVRFTTRPSVQIPAGRACRITEDKGALTVHIRAFHVASHFCDTMNVLCDQVMEGWAQTWANDSPMRADEPPTGACLACVSWRIDQTGELPEGVDCFPLEKRGRFTWTIRKGVITDQLCAELNRYMERLVGDGLWVQKWEGAAPLHSRPRAVHAG
ncbi:hypothetical protein ACIRQP_03590 [Streptomyces sp. NPDC102274]|uniref:hypothetical protein n=1 Tax=Streptomyces sp. NPDC102274 TaxID=3366151 RepID=UPI00382108AD